MSREDQTTDTADNAHENISSLVSQETLSSASPSASLDLISTSETILSPAPFASTPDSPSLPPLSKRQQTDSPLKIRVKQLYQNVSDIFAFLDIPRPLLYAMYGTDYRYFNSNISLAKRNWCTGCLMSEVTCICWDNSVSVAKLGSDVMCVLRMIYDGDQFDSWYRRCQSIGIQNLMVEFGEQKDMLRRLFMQRYSNYVALVEKQGIKRGNLFLHGTVAAQTMYNNTWNRLATRQADVLVFFADGGKVEACPEMWKCRNIHDMRRLLESRRQRYGNLPLMKEYEYRMGYLLAQFESEAIRNFVFQSTRDTYIRKDKGQKVVQPLTWELFLLMQFALFHDEGYRRRVEATFPELTRTNLFPHWLRMMSVRVDVQARGGADYRYVYFMASMLWRKECKSI
ncbi:LANO_0F00100g1_1 [Lachancea nothofagi CBS 11611]|uniref:LANO_0F00100g1_1 n=1 Tax=Lachancea nothofagi CBS 11611 TaxID=1266666 RepID=A0A1G4K517_9SACH|nr:LANO_0F00100g1_1 [Lachancea nothofagi CBS 11611]